VIRPTCLLSHFASTTLLALALVWLSAAAVQAGEQLLVTDEKSADSTQFSRFLDNLQPDALLAPPGNPKAPAVTCEADQNRADELALIRRAEMQLAEMRRQQLAVWAAKGWTAKQAAAAGEAVVLNGSGYNLTGAPLR
jgi:hypothetical protein